MDCYEESGMEFYFCDDQVTEKMDEKSYSGLKSVDFLVGDKKSTDYYLIEVKNFENDMKDIKDQETKKKKLEERKKKDLEKLTVGAADFSKDMGMKLKDSLLKMYAEGYEFSGKTVHFCLLINFKLLEPAERITIFKKIEGYIPGGLEKEKFQKFYKIKFDMPKIKELEEKYPNIFSKVIFV